MALAAAIAAVAAVQPAAAAAAAADTHAAVAAAGCFAAFSLLFQRRNLAGSLIGGIKETQEMLDFCGEHNITSDIELINIDQINEAYERLLKSDVKYRFVIDMKSLT